MEDLDARCCLRARRLDVPAPTRARVASGELLVFASRAEVPGARRPLEIVLGACPAPREDDVLAVCDESADDGAALEEGLFWFLAADPGLRVEHPGNWEPSERALVASRWSVLEWQLKGSTWKLRSALPACRPCTHLPPSCGLPELLCLADRPVGGAVRLRANEHLVLDATLTPSVVLAVPELAWWNELGAPERIALAAQLVDIRFAVSVVGGLSLAIVGPSELQLQEPLTGALIPLPDAAPRPLGGFYYAEWRFDTCGLDVPALQCVAVRSWSP
jgi:hypothetical protein